MQTGKWAPTMNALRNRAREVRKWLKARPEKHIILVTHGGLLHYLTEDWEDGSMYQGELLPLFRKKLFPGLTLFFPLLSGTGWVNTEYRTYEFAEKIDSEDIEGNAVEEGDDLTIVETPASRTRRGKPAQAPSRAEQKVLYRHGLEGWEKQGLQPSLKEGEGGKVPEGEEVNGSRI